MQQLDRQLAELQTQLNQVEAAGDLDTCITLSQQMLSLTHETETSIHVLKAEAYAAVAEKRQCN